MGYLGYLIPTELRILEENTVLRGKVNYFTAWMNWILLPWEAASNTCCSLSVMTQFYL